jgi:hypothetical protein
VAWYYNTVSGELANESGIAALPYETGFEGWHTLKIPGSDTYTQAAADAKKEFPSGSAPTGGQVQGLKQVPGGAAKAAANAIPGLGSGIQSVTDFLKGLTAANLWIRVAKVAVGGALVLIGLAHITGADSIVRKLPVPIPI